MAENRRGGTIFLKVNSVLRDAKGNFTYNLGGMKREPVLNADGTVAGYSEAPQVPRIEGVITDQRDLVLSDFINIENETITLELGNGKVIDHAQLVVRGRRRRDHGNGGNPGCCFTDFLPRKPTRGAPALKAGRRRASRPRTSSTHSRSPLKTRGSRSSG